MKQKKQTSHYRKNKIWKVIWNKKWQMHKLANSDRLRLIFLCFLYGLILTNNKSQSPFNDASTSIISLELQLPQDRTWRCGWRGVVFMTTSPGCLTDVHGGLQRPALRHTGCDSRPGCEWEPCWGFMNGCSLHFYSPAHVRVADARTCGEKKNKKNHIGDRGFPQFSISNNSSRRKQNTNRERAESDWNK